jgi:hypothetical protein
VLPGSFIDLIPDGTAPCGLAPNICLSDFIANGRKKNIDPFHQDLISKAETLGTKLRILEAHDLIGDRPHYFVGSSDLLFTTSSSEIIIGCATKKRPPSPSTFYIETTFSLED